MAKVLVVDDDPALLKVLRIALSATGIEVVTATGGADGISQAALAAPDAVLLDLGLPDVDGVDVCRAIREWSDAPIIVLSADGTEERKVEALDAGADDYMTKPFGMNELSARLRVAGRHRALVLEAAASAGGTGPGRDGGTGSGSAGARAAGGDAGQLVAGPLELDLVHHEARLDGQPLELTRREFAFLAFLARHAGRICTHRMILEAVWDSHYDEDARYLREYAYRLRKKLGDEHGELLRTRPGIGYQLVVDRDLQG
jgi:two-component system KDP operon response regulator KdpE